MNSSPDFLPNWPLMPTCTRHILACRQNVGIPDAYKQIKVEGSIDVSPHFRFKLNHAPSAFYQVLV